MMKLIKTSVLLALISACQSKPEQNQKETYSPLVTEMYTADPSAHVFEGALYIYPSHDIDGGFLKTIWEVTLQCVIIMY